MSKYPYCESLGTRGCLSTYLFPRLDFKFDVAKIHIVLDNAQLPMLPRSKRTLAESVSHAEAVGPLAKKTSAGKALEKENNTPAAVKKDGKATMSLLLGQWMLNS